MSFRVHSDTVTVNHGGSEVIIANRDPEGISTDCLWVQGILRVYPVFSSINIDLCFTNSSNSPVVVVGFG